MRVPASTAGPGPAGAVGELAVPSPPVPGDTLCLEVEARLFADPTVTSVVVLVPPGEMRVLSRSRLDRALIGANGYGRALYARRGVGEVPTAASPLVFDATTAVATAGEAMLARDPECRYEDALVRWPDGLIGTVSISAVMERLTRVYQHQALHDPLTDLTNRALFVDRVGHALDRVGRTGTLLAVLFVDLDDFKGVNDSYGHHVGDQALVLAAERLRSCLRQGDTASRFGGDEFAILLEELPGPAEAYLVGQRLIEEMKEPMTIEDIVVPMSASVGVAVTGGGESADDLLRSADTAMYAAKDRGKGRAEVFEPGMLTSTVHRRTLRGDMASSLENAEFVAHFQPIVELDSGRIVGTEALARWDHGDGAVLAPSEFITLAEDTGLIVPIGLEILRQAVIHTQAWNDRYAIEPPLRVNVNLSARQVQAPGLVSDVARVLDEAGMDPARLTLEITESVLLGGAEAAEVILGELKGLGVSLALDDFGTGYSSLGYLQRFPVDVLKLDKMFVDHLGTGDPNDPRLARAVITLGEMLDLAVVAEGVERVEQVVALRHLGCRFAQGYYFARPLAAHEMDARLAGAGQKVSATSFEIGVPAGCWTRYR